MTSYTVTGSASGGNAFSGTVLTVKVLTGAAATQNGATAVSASANPPQIAVTPNASSSWVYGAVGNENGDTSNAFTPNGSTTFSTNVSDAANGISEGTFRSTSTTTASTPVTVGGTAPGKPCYIAAVEILASGTLAEDASSPASANDQSNPSVTTASFTPPAGALLVAMLVTHTGGGGGNTLAVTSTPSLTWSQLAADSKPATGVFVARVPTLPSGGLLLAAIP